MAFREVEEETKRLFRLSAEELHQRGVEAFLVQELRYVKEKLYSLLQLSKIQADFDRNTLSNPGQLEKTRAGENHSRIGLLKNQIKKIRWLLEKLRQD